MRARRLLVAAALLLALSAAALYLSARRARPQPAPAPAATPPTELVLAASIRAQHVAPVAAPVEGVIDALLVEVGEQVYEGQLLGRIRNDSLSGHEQSAAAELERAQARVTELQDQLIALRLEASRTRAEAARAQADLVRAERAYLRQQMLHKEGATPRLVYEKSARDYDAAKSVHDSADQLARAGDDRLASLVRTHDAARRLADEKTQALDDARQQAASAEIHAPAAGLIVGRAHQPGDEVTPDIKDLFEIATDTTALEAVVTPDGATLARLRPGLPASLSTPDSPEPIATQIDEIRSGQLILRFTAPESIRPGSTAQIRIKTP